MNYMSNCAAPLISVIIPVYKTEAYLEKMCSLCHDAVLSQSGDYSGGRRLPR